MRRSSSRKEINKNPYSAYQRGGIDFYRRRIRWNFTRNDSISLSGWIWVKGRWKGIRIFQEHHVDVLADFNRICTVRSTACHSSSSSLEFDLLIHPPFTLSFLSLSLSLLHHLCPFDHGESILSDSGSR